jgi:hypothetical protein
MTTVAEPATLQLQLSDYRLPGDLCRGSIRALAEIQRDGS